MPTPHADAEWSTAEVNDLPDDAFLFVEDGGKKDDGGKTVPRSLRHFPYKGKDGAIDLPHLRDAIGRIPQSDLPAEKKASLQKHAEELLAKAESKKDEADHVQRGVSRFDRSELKPLKILPNGWAKADGYLGRTGCLTYHRNGKPWVEYRPPDEAFRADSLDTFTGVPLTNGHPPPNPNLHGAQLLDAENTRDFQVGHVVGTPRRDGDMVRADMLITDAAAIDDLRAGRAQLSCGYLADVDPTPGVTPDGQHYDAIQRNVRGNHVALVAEGRAGPQARVRVDSLEMEPVASTHGQGDRPMLTKIKLDGVEFEVECRDPAFVSAFERYRTDHKAKKAEFEAKVDSLKAKRDEARTEVEKEKARADAAEAALKAKTDELSKAPEQIRKEIEARAKLNGIAREILGSETKVDEMSATDLMKAVIVATDPEAKLDGADPTYLAARFDAAVSYAGRSALERGSGPAVSRGDAAAEPDAEDDDPDGKKAAFKKASDEAWKPKKKRAA